MFGHNELIERLLDHGFGINNGNNCYMAPLGCAIIEQHADTCRLLIERGPRMDFIGKTGSAMHVAAEYSTPEIMEMLMNAGQDINLLYRDEMPLRRAAERGTVENVQWLLEQGSDLWMRGLRDRSILDHSVSNRHLDVFDYLLQIYLESEPPEYWKEDALTNAAHACNLEACQKLLDLGANVNGNPHSSATPLFKSVRVMYGRKFRQDVFDLLMEHDPNL
ncbi:ankyrin repeat-containing domain protein [Gorgonomyces haynaldii]|nr:ankyrin repeat-containing domain protein [Gorgonomyces haynaldii]